MATNQQNTRKKKNNPGRFLPKEGATGIRLRNCDSPIIKREKPVHVRQDMPTCGRSV
jgi:hypothetical protein